MKANNKKKKHFLFFLFVWNLDSYFASLVLFRIQKQNGDTYKTRRRRRERELTVSLSGKEAVALFEIDGGVSPRAL